MIPILSILTPAVPSRIANIGILSQELHRRIFLRGAPVEHLVLLDNKRRSVGLKRDALLRMARGKYVAFVDDDDQVSEHYVERLVAAAVEDPDVITFRQRASIDGAEGEIQFGLGNVNENFMAGRTAKRNAWHVCAWRRTLAILSHFPDCNYGEDWAFAAPLCALPNLREIHVSEVLHHYIHSSKTTEAPPPLAEE